MNKINFKPLVGNNITEHKQIVVSSVIDEDRQTKGYSIGVKLSVDDNGKETSVFLKGGISALGFLTKDDLLIIRDTIDDALRTVTF